MLLRKTIITTVQNVPGKVVKKNKFKSDKNLILIHHNEVIETSFKKKTILKVMEPYGDIKQFSKRNKLKIDQFETVSLFLNEAMAGD